MKPERHPIQLSPLARANLRCGLGETTAILCPYHGVLVADDIEVDGVRIGGNIESDQYDKLPSQHYYLTIPATSQIAAMLKAGEACREDVLPEYLFSSVDAVIDHLNSTLRGSVEKLIVRYRRIGDHPDRPGIVMLLSVGIVGVIPAVESNQPVSMMPYVNTSAAEPRSDG